MRFLFLVPLLPSHTLSRTLSAACCKRSSSPSLAHTLSRTLSATNALEKLCEDFALYVYDFVITVYIFIHTHTLYMLLAAACYERS
jgi:hypothetical protein